MSRSAAGGSALRDSALYFGAQLGARILNFVYYLILTQNLPIDEFGVLNYALSIVILLDIVMDLGLSRHAMREISKAPERGGAFARRILPYKLAVSLLVFLGFCTMISLSDQPATYKAINILAALGLLFSSPAMFLENVLQAHHRFALISLAHIVLSCVQFVVGVSLLWMGGSTILISLTFALTTLVYAGMVGWGARKLLTEIPAKADYRALARSVPSAFPYLISAVVILFAIRAEFVILGFFGSKADLAVFGMATKIVEASLLLPMAFTTVMSPRFSMAHGQKKIDLTRIYYSGLEMILLLSIPLCLAAMAFVPVAQQILGTEEYDAIDDILYIIFLGYIPASVFLYNTSTLFGAVSQKRPLIILSALAIIQIGINLAMQAPYGMWGASASFVMFMVIAATGTTISIIYLFVGKSGLGSALIAPAIGALAAEGALIFFGVGTFGLIAAIILCVATIFAFRRMCPGRVTALDLNPTTRDIIE
jgi:PST family polysaccharide transporter